MGPPCFCNRCVLGAISEAFLNRQRPVVKPLVSLILQRKTMLILVFAGGLTMSFAGAILLAHRTTAEAWRRSVTELTPDWRWIGFLLFVGGGLILLGATAAELVEWSTRVPFPVDLDGA